jgi:hypothetical protein
MLKKILLALAVLIVVFAIVVAMQPSEFRVVRTAAIAAPPAVVFEQVNDLQKWEAWSPWAKLDPAVKNTFDGPAAGTGAIFHWSGNEDVGEGEMTITESRPHELVRMNLQFIKPFESACTTEFTFRPQDNQTLVGWSMSGHNNFISKAMCLFMDMDAMIGADFEKGLANMKAVAEAAPPKTADQPE